VIFFFFIQESDFVQCLFKANTDKRVYKDPLLVTELENVTIMKSGLNMQV